MGIYPRVNSHIDVESLGGNPMKNNLHSWWMNSTSNWRESMIASDGYCNHVVITTISQSCWSDIMLYVGCQWFLNNTICICVIYYQQIVCWWCLMPWYYNCHIFITNYDCHYFDDVGDDFCPDDLMIYSVSCWMFACQPLQRWLRQTDNNR